MGQVATTATEISIKEMNELYNTVTSSTWPQPNFNVNWEDTESVATDWRDSPNPSTKEREVRLQKLGQAHWSATEEYGDVIVYGVTRKQALRRYLKTLNKKIKSDRISLVQEDGKWREKTEVEVAIDVMVND